MGDLKSAKPAPKCQDKMIISGQKYCQSTGPDVAVSGSKLKVAFKTNKKGTATGAVCTAYCVPPPPPPGNPGENSPRFDGFVRITSFVISPEVSGSVTFKESSDCDV